MNLVGEERVGEDVSLGIRPSSKAGPMNFVAIDFETANANMASICQVGIADFRDGKLYDCFVSLVDPEDYFDDMNIVIHGIDEADVVGAPIFPELYRRLSNMIAGRIVVSHTSFDRTALRQAAIRYNLPEIECHWLDSARVVRRTWRECADSGYGLRPVAEMLGINFSHHNALEDARSVWRNSSKGYHCKWHQCRGMAKEIPLQIGERNGEARN